jgi:hypothetical protein
MVLFIRQNYDWQFKYAFARFAKATVKYSRFQPKYFNNGAPYEVFIPNDHNICFNRNSGKSLLSR